MRSAFVALLFLLSPDLNAQADQALAPVEKVNLQIAVTDTRTDSGFVLVSIYDNKKAYPDKAEQAVVRMRLNVKDAAHFTVPNLVPGRYAVVIAHDENDNGKLDTNFVGMPKEGFGFSQNVMGTFGAPSFKKATIDVSGPETTTHIKMKYFL